MTIEGGRPVRDPGAGVPASPFARLRPFAAEPAHDAAASLSKLAGALAGYEARALIHLRLIDGDSTEHWEVQAGARKSAARRRRPKEADVHIVVRRETWMAIARGQLSPFDALFAGRLRVGGDVGLATRLARHLSDPSVPFVSPC